MRPDSGDQHCPIDLYDATPTNVHVNNLNCNTEQLSTTMHKKATGTGKKGGEGKCKHVEA